MTPQNLDTYQLILASKSPRRQQLLKELGLHFQVLVSDVEEYFPPELGMTAIPEYLAELKATAVRKRLPDDSLVIAADTIVWKDNEVLGKPANKDEAVAMLKHLSGSQHQVITGVNMQSAEKKYSFHAVTEVWFDELNDSEIKYYIDRFKPYDKAGGYGIQEWIGYVGVKKIEGSFFNVMGLPVHKVYQFLKKF
ncbi:Maf family nucleotide pyrophosphatase [Sunxiuqinia elliptica]|uniref:dTTP/UTP pyrophosphatase n=1 Tax=Sunxiuqinia elliptica TaxID=655355 RepID=A0A1I2LWU2_9BACT|nr:Maf family nucleotide pyrophosphatase [Sunxiuqinia elliptica]TDN95741.1 septum formation protein [Sunxiuqinia elliptica]TDO66936.1 septum formation protein [Sunxiuqinia elliptica]SFF83674.1 septum formation protein [Sunxiuqinia elliptica]